jgi:hypothetical protein
MNREEIIEECAKICEKPFYRLAPSCIDIDPDSLEPVNPLVCQREVFAFFNDCMKLRAGKIREIKATMK